jgi:M6 family metalloprotease-like protein
VKNIAKRKMMLTFVFFLFIGQIIFLAGSSEALNKRGTLMPPHPFLWERYLKGEISLPAGITDKSGGFKEFDHVASAQSGLTGSVRALAVLVDFSDKVKTVQATFFDSLIFTAPVVGRGSVRDYFNEVSYGQIDIVTLNLPSTLGWQRAPWPSSFYTFGNYCISSFYPLNCQKLAEDIVDAINGVVDFSQYDNNHDGVAEPIMIVHAGKGAEYTGNPNDIWSHSWSLRNERFLDGVYVRNYVIMPEYYASVSANSSDMTIGVFAHEMGHGFWGLPDLYDTDYSSQGVGSWSLMALGSWNGIHGMGESPAWPDAYSRIKMGITSPNEITINGSITIPQATAQVADGTIFRLKNSSLNTNEYFLLENRQQAANSYDEYLPGSGLLIWHIDESQSGNTNECKTYPHSSCASNHYLVALEQADGLRGLENNLDGGDDGDPFPGSTGNLAWTNLTNPESSSWYSTDDTCIRVTNTNPSGSDMDADVTISCLNPVPSITSLDPSSKTAGDAGFLLTVDGTNFMTSSVVRWNGANRTTTYVSSTRVTADIPASDLASEGTADIRVFNHAPGGGESDALPFTINIPTAVTLSSLTASSEFNEISLDWQTTNEIGLVGFNILRAESPQGVKQKLNSSLLPAQFPGQNLGANYKFREQADQGQRLYYWIELVTVNNTSSVVGPVEVTAKFIRYLPLLIEDAPGYPNLE